MKPKLSQNLNTSNYDSVEKSLYLESVKLINLRDQHCFFGSINLLFYFVLMFVLVMFIFVNLVNNNMVL